MELSLARNSAGDPREACDRIEAFREAGVTMLSVPPAGTGPARLFSTVKNRLQGA